MHGDRGEAINEHSAMATSCFPVNTAVLFASVRVVLQPSSIPVQQFLTLKLVVTIKVIAEAEGPQEILGGGGISSSSGSH